MVYGVWCMESVYGVWRMVYGVWYMVHGVWCMVYGVWCVVVVTLQAEALLGHSVPLLDARPSGDDMSKDPVYSRNG
jgi:hypothetical protein